MGKTQELTSLFTRALCHLNTISETKPTLQPSQRAAASVSSLPHGTYILRHGEHSPQDLGL